MWLLAYALAGLAICYLLWFIWKIASNIVDDMNGNSELYPSEDSPLKDDESKDGRKGLSVLVTEEIIRIERAMEESNMNVENYESARRTVAVLKRLLFEATGD